MIPKLLKYIDENITLSLEAVLIKKRPCKSHNITRVLSGSEDLQSVLEPLSKRKRNRSGIKEKYCVSASWIDEKSPYKLKPD